MGIFQGDVVIGEIVNLILEDIRKNPWLIEDILSDFIENPYLAKKYGIKEIQNCKEWFANNKISVYNTVRPDHVERDYVTIAVGNSSEDNSLATCSDMSVFVEQFDPSEINKPIPYIVSPFTPLSYDSSTGFVEVPSDLDLTVVAHGQPIVDPSTGSGFLVDRAGAVNGAQGIFLQATNGSFPSFSMTSAAIVAQYRYYRARRERATFREAYTIGCHSAGQYNIALWLSSIVQYGIMRYREGLLENCGFQISTVSISEITQEANFGGDLEYGRYISLTGVVENSWIKSPKRVIEAISVRDISQEAYSGGLKIQGPESDQPDENGIWKMSGENV